MKLNWTYIILGVVILGVAFLLGWFAKPSTTPKVEVKERVVYDTTETKKVVKETVTKTIEKVDTVYQDKGGFTYTDSIEGEKDGLEYKVTHTLSKSDSVYSFWDVEVKGLVETVKEYVVKDSIQTITEVEYRRTPFFLNEWFYVSLIQFIGLISVTITALL